MLNLTYRGVEIAKLYTCPGTSKSAIRYLSIESFTCPILILFDLILYVPSTIFQLYSRVEPVLS